MEAKDIGDSQTAEVVLTADLSGAGNLTFDWAVSSESCCDKLKVYVDGSNILNRGGVESGSESYSLTTGVHEIRFAYTKDGSVSSNKDTAWIDNIQLPPNDIGGSQTLFIDAAPAAPIGQYQDHTSSSISMLFDTEDLDVKTLEIHRKAEADTSYSPLRTINYPLLPREYVDNNYDEALGHTYKAKVIDVAGQASPFSSVVKPGIIQDFEADLSDWTVNESNFEIKTDRVYAGAQSAGMNETSMSNTLAAELAIGINQPSYIGWYWSEDTNQYGSATHLINSNGNLELAIGTENPQWNMWDGTGMNQEIYGGDGYDRWIHVEITAFDWTNGTYDYRIEDMQSGHVETGTRNLKNGVDIAKIGLGDKPGNSNRLYTWWDNIKIQ
jgi:hypothetical protein